MASTRSPKGIASQAARPAALTGAELPFLLAFLSGSNKTIADLGAKGAGTLLAWLRDEGPMAYRVLASWSEAKQYVIALEFVNMTPHGGYVEEISVTKPAMNLGFHVALPKRKQEGMGLGGKPAPGEVPPGEFVWCKTTDLLPLYVAPGDSSTIVLRLIDDQAGTLSRSDSAELSYEFSITGGKEASNNKKKQNTKRATVRLRKHGPLYLK